MFKDFDVDCWNWVMLADMGLRLADLCWYGWHELT